MTSNINIEQVIEDQKQQIEPIVMECLKELYHHLPKDHKFLLSNGKTATFKPHVEPRKHTETGEYEFAIDIKIADFPVDHIEFYMTQTGHGGPV